MELRQYFTIFGKWLWLIVLSVVIASGSSYLASKKATPLFRTKTTLMISRVTENPDPNSADLYTSQQLAYTYAQLATREPVLKGALQSIGLDWDWHWIQGQVSAYNVPQTQLLEINVVDSEPLRAKALADAIAQQLILLSPSGNTQGDPQQQAFVQSQLADLKTKIEASQESIKELKKQLDESNSARQIQDLQSQIDLHNAKISDWQKTYSQMLTTMGNQNINAPTVVEEASVPSIPISPNVKMNVLLAAALGLALSLGGVILIEYLDDTVKNSDDITRSADLPVIGTIGHISGGDYQDKLVSLREPLSPVSEAYRVLRMNLQFSSIDSPARTLVVTSPKPRDGKSITISNLAVALAQSGLKVIVVDADMRKPMLNKIFKLPNRFGLSNLILNHNPEAQNFLQDSEVENLRIITSGVIPPNPAEMLGSARMGKLIEDLKQQADIVLFDTPPTLLVSDASTLGVQVDGVILVCYAGHTRRDEIRKAADELRRLHIHLLGVVLNRNASGTRKSYLYYKYHYYGEKEKSKEGRRIFGKREAAGMKDQVSEKPASHTLT